MTIHVHRAERVTVTGLTTSQASALATILHEWAGGREDDADDDWGDYAPWLPDLIEALRYFTDLLVNDAAEELFDVLCDHMPASAGGEVMSKQRNTVNWYHGGYRVTATITAEKDED